MNKKDVTIHQYGKHYIGAYYDWKSDDKCRGNKYVIFCDRRCINSRLVRDLMKLWVVDGRFDLIDGLNRADYIMYKFAKTDEERFKYFVSVMFHLKNGPKFDLNKFKTFFG